MPTTPKIRTLKGQIKKLNEEQLDIVKNSISKEELGKLTDEEQVKARDELKTKLSDNRVLARSASQELKEARMNKNESEFFSFTPTSYNRKHRRDKIKQNRLNAKHTRS